MENDTELDIDCNNSENLQFITTINNQIAPTWYNNMVKKQIGKQSVIDRRILEYEIPDIVKMDKYNDLNKCFNCYQPNWKSNCL